VFPCGKVAVAARLSDDDPQKAVLQKYLSDYAAFTGGESADAFGGHGWDALKMIVGALQGLKNGMSLRDRRAAVRDYLETRIVDWPGISGTFTMSPTDHNGLTKESLLVVIVRDGKLVSFPESDW
jgi:branched-chain amino acid transport system substrate-binding protein